MFANKFLILMTVGELGKWLMWLWCLLVLRVLDLMKYCENCVAFDELSSRCIVMRIWRGWLWVTKNQREGVIWKDYLIRALWRKYILLFNFSYVHFYVDHLLHFIHDWEYDSFRISICGSDVSILLCHVDRVGSFRQTWLFQLW